MNKHSRHIPNSGSANVANPAKKTGQSAGSKPPVKPERTADAKTPEREEARKSLPRDADKPSAKASAKEPPRAAKGDDDLMSQEPRKS